MLARLSAVTGVGAARVEATGRFFWLELVAGADPGRVAPEAVEVLAGRARILPPDEALAQLSGRELGDPWLRAGEVQLISLVEARVLSVRISGEAARRTGADADEREAVAEAIRAGLFRAMERAHAEGGRASSGWIYEAWPAIAAEAVSRCRERLRPEIALGVAEVLPGLLTR
ncbi:MAG: hypothetical protein QM704_21065 [Anaeromyxobacteraceae bacterium]